MPQSKYNPHNHGAGGFLGTFPCGCTAGWIAGINSNRTLLDGQVIDWLRNGCTIKPLLEGEQFKRERCPLHQKED